jgi:hypothetical protein
MQKKATARTELINIFLHPHEFIKLVYILVSTTNGRDAVDMQQMIMHTIPLTLCVGYNNEDSY